MQHTRQMSNLNFRTVITGSAWVAGLLLAGSDGPLMPWINIAGLTLFLAASLLLSRQLRSNTGVKKGLTIPKPDKKPGSCIVGRTKRSQRIKIRYA